MAEKTEKKKIPEREKIGDAIAQFQQLQQQLQAVLMQKESVKLQLGEIDKAKEELEKVKEGEDVFRAAGPILIKTSVPGLKKNLSEEKENLNSLIGLLEKQEKILKDKLVALQGQLSASLGAAK